jgi:hypothetical protein
MKNYVILNSRKRAIIALAHTVAFLLIAVLTGMKEVHALHRNSSVGLWAVAAIYPIVSSVLLWLTAISGPLQEKIYFACCSTSALFGLGRQILGDSTLHAAVYVRVLMMLCAVTLGTLILRGHSPQVDSPVLAPADSN